MFILLRLYVLCFLLVIVFPLKAQVSHDHEYTIAELKEDFRFVKKQLEDTHPALYRYTSRKTFRIFFDSLYTSIRGPMTEQAFLSRLQLLNEKIADGHTMFLPSAATMAYNNREGRFLPLLVRCLDNKLYIRENNSPDTSLHAGDEILAINHVPASKVMPALLQRQIRDGYNQTYPRWILEQYFAAYYSFVYGQPAQFSLLIRQGSGDTLLQTVGALTKDSIRRMHRPQPDSAGQWLYPVIEAPAGIRLTTLPFMREVANRKLAWLKITTFDADVLKATYHQDYQAATDSVFALLKKEPVTDLVLDLRDNQGGDFEPGQYLLSYLLKHPLTYLPGGKATKLITPVPGHFTGKLYVLMNGGTFSSAAVTAAYLKECTSALLMGEESGGNAYEISGDPVALQLPHTGIQAFISTTNYVIRKGDNRGHGVFPDKDLGEVQGSANGLIRLIQNEF
ncbi:S41 family peptidase [Chitinophaga eiseniae]|uniref:Tail specific protease domain-containing protein n=1 Tax=Chitinophaga eiseniae TaxID=634771 RepID=A0A847SE25_9BACT|nr:S41 family peptidase [Chitinophaga eiseniae]NLR81440.1 hypothetical protein [Chitinophaga eiseniae]